MCLTGISELKDVRSFDDLIKFFRNPCGDYTDYKTYERVRAVQMTRKEYNNLSGVGVLNQKRKSIRCWICYRTRRR